MKFNDLKIKKGGRRKFKQTEIGVNQGEGGDWGQHSEMK